MESRYALRSLEGVIGRDFRTIEGRKAEFRHTPAHRRMVMGFLDRRDSMMVLQSLLLSTSSMLGNSRIDIGKAADAANEIRELLVKATFPYIKNTPEETITRKQSYDELFDELEAIEKAKKEQEENERQQRSNASEPPEKHGENGEMV